MAYKEISGNIFNTKAMAVVNTVNCVGAMGKESHSISSYDFQICSRSISEFVFSIFSNRAKYCHTKNQVQSF